MAKPNYAFAKRQRDLAKKKKKEEKRRQKAEAAAASSPDASTEQLGAPDQASTAETETENGAG